MTDREMAALIDRVSAGVADTFRPRLREIERESDRLLGEMRAMRRRHALQVARLSGEAVEARSEADRQTQRVLELEALLDQATKPALTVEDSRSDTAA